MDKKYVTQAFSLRLKGRFDVLLAYYGDTLFHLPAIIVVAQIKDELGISIPEHSIYTLKKRLKKSRLRSTDTLSAIGTATEIVRSPLILNTKSNAQEAMDNPRIE